jgi:hypothetical protein|nr:MAG TPA: hypothetical protein [Caudoviricetes sp.]
MNKEFTNEDIINAAKHCATNADCDNCPFFATLEIEGCIETFTRYIVNNTKNEPALSANSTSSEVVSKDTDSTHLNNSTLLDICQEGIEEMAKIALDDYPNEFLTGYVEAFKHNIERLRGGDGK